MEVNSCPVNSKNSVKHFQWNISQSLRIIQEVIVRWNVSSIHLRELLGKQDTPTNKTIQQFLQVYRVTPNKNAPSAITPAEVTFAKIKSVFDKLLSKHGHTKWLENDSKLVKSFHLHVSKQQVLLGDRYSEQTDWKHDIHNQGA